MDKYRKLESKSSDEYFEGGKQKKNVKAVVRDN